MSFVASLLLVIIWYTRIVGGINTHIKYQFQKMKGEEGAGYNNTRVHTFEPIEIVTYCSHWNRYHIRDTPCTICAAPIFISFFRTFDSRLGNHIRIRIRRSHFVESPIVEHQHQITKRIYNIKNGSYLCCDRCGGGGDGVG